MISTHPGSRRMLWYSWRLLLTLSILCSGLVAVPAFAQQNVHVVGYGEYLSSIAVQYGVPMSELIAANGLSNPNVIVPGQRLVIPGAGGNAASYDTVATSSSAANIMSRHSHWLSRNSEPDSTRMTSHRKTGCMFLEKTGMG